MVAGHLAEHGALAVDHFIVGEGQNEVLGEGVEQREGQVVVVVTAVDGILRHIFEHVVHPAHVRDPVGCLHPEAIVYGIDDRNFIEMQSVRLC